MMLERWRVVSRGENETNFKIFYQMLCGLDAKSKRCPLKKSKILTSGECGLHKTLDFKLPFLDEAQSVPLLIPVTS